ncbi:hypothetical protein J1605_009660 [Eschrichtius robustus]|uniref:Uncharacterized protein n=1 Tax=Eschrichtius robustus TaxID=9764 RepID=A0AB34GVS3_ESCRO|nr:hypothetical protein J1605_009660 [Eschrichtius robustus]
MLLLDLMHPASSEVDASIVGAGFVRLNKQQLQLLKERFQAFLDGETQIVADEAFCNAVRSYYEETSADSVDG